MKKPSYFLNRRFKIYSGKDRDNIQIIFMPNNGGIGHYIFVYFEYITKAVKISDSDYCVENKSKLERILKRFYGRDIKIKWEKPMTTQTDSYSCGVFAIIYGMLRIQGNDPKNCGLFLDPTQSDHTNFLRQHIFNMFEHEELIPFTWFNQF